MPQIGDRSRPLACTLLKRVAANHSFRNEWRLIVQQIIDFGPKAFQKPPLTNRHSSREIMTTRIAGGLLLGYNPMVPGQGLKPLA